MTATLNIPLTDAEIISNSRFEIDYGQISLFDGLAYILGGEAIFSLVSVATGKKFTYKCEQATRWDPKQNKKVPYDRWFLSVLTGPDNNSDYTYAGTIDEKNNIGRWVIRTTTKSGMTAEADSFKAFVAVFDILQSSVERINAYREKLLIYHDGNCSKCGRHLTDIVSVATSLGPVCAPDAHKQFKAGCKKRGIKIDKETNKLIYPAGYVGKKWN
jgi:hypothetical protein